MTYIFVGGRQWGKTTEMLRWMRAAPQGETRVLICHSTERAFQLAIENKDLFGWQFVSPVDLHRPEFGKERRYLGDQKLVYGIDDLDLVLSQLLGFRIARASATGVRLPNPPEEVMNRLVQSVLHLSPEESARVLGKWPDD